MTNVCVFLSASDLEKKYVKAAEDLGKLLADNKFGLVYGGSDKGLMKVISSAVQKAGGKVIGVTMELLKDSRKRDADEMTIAPDLATRKKIMHEKSDAVVVMVGGIGTLDEVMEILELKRHGVHNKPVIILNTDNFYECFKTQLEKMEKDGFLSRKLRDLLLFADNPREVIDLLATIEE